jgi:RNA polymerase sigma-70 factor, ECF subfamily
MYRMIVERADAAEHLIRAVYPELREMASRLLRRERENHTLQRTALVHEAFIRLFGGRPVDGISPQALLARAAHQMRQILIDYGRKHRSQKRGGGWARVPLYEVDPSFTRDEDSLLALNQAVDRLGKLDPRALSTVELKFFCGCSNAQAAEILSVSDGTVEADWQFARSWLFGALADKSTRFPV